MGTNSRGRPPGDAWLATGLLQTCGCSATLSMMSTEQYLKRCMVSSGTQQPCPLYPPLQGSWTYSVDTCRSQGSQGCDLAIFPFNHIGVFSSSHTPDMWCALDERSLKGYMGEDELMLLASEGILASADAHQLCWKLDPGMCCSPRCARPCHTPKKTCTFSFHADALLLHMLAFHVRPGVITVDSARDEGMVLLQLSRHLLKLICIPASCSSVTFYKISLQPILFVSRV